MSGRPIKNVLKTLQKHRIIQQTNKKKKSGFVKATYFQSNGKISKSLKELKYVLFRSSVRNVARKFKFKP